MDIRIFDKDINFLGEVDNFTSLFYISKWETYGEFEFHIKDFNRELIKKGNIIMLDKDGTRAGVIEHFEINQENDEDIAVKGFSLGYWLSNRITVPPVSYAYHAFNTNVEDIMIALVKTNAVDPANVNRKIPNLIVEPSKSRGIKLNFQTRYKNLDEELTKLSKTSSLGWNIVLDYKAKKFIFKVLDGKDLSTEQSTNPPQVFSVDYDNIRKQNYLESNIGYKNMAYVAGQGEGVEREIEPLNNDFSGFDRRETFIDARDIEEGGNLTDRGKVKLSETPQITTFECEVEPIGYKANWNLGDIVTTINKKLGLVMHNRVAEVREVWEQNGYKVEPTFGTSLPTLGEKIKQTQDTPLQESVQGPPGETGEKGERGPQGYNVQYLWNGTQLGIKREDETSYTYVDLKGAKGDTGPKGEQGVKGDKGVQGERGLQGIQGLQGPQGPQGERGLQGSKGENGYTPVKGIDYFDGPKGDKGDVGPTGPVGPKGAQGPRGDTGIQGIQGPKGDKGDIGPQGPKGVQGPAGNGQSYVVFQKYFIATEGQKIFSWNDGYVYPIGINAIAAYINGTRVGNKAFKETSGSSIEFINALSNGDNVFIEAMQAVVDLQGPKGDTGAKGEQGIQGAQGVKGNTGAQGPKGDIGAKGATGAKGDPGNSLEFTWNGTQLGVRVQGTATYTYVDLKGAKGDKGIQGIQGSRGDIGPQGLKGDKGDAGAQGPKGDIGAKGDPGTTDYNNLLNRPTSLPANGGTANCISFVDSRNVDDKPSGITNRKLTCAFKCRTSVGNPPTGASGTYVFILNVVGWNGFEGSGGWPIQVAFGTEGIAYRQAINADTWGSWVKVSNLKDIPTRLSQFEKNINFDERYYTESEINTQLNTKVDKDGIGLKNANDLPSTWSKGIYWSEVYNNGFPCIYGNCLTIKSSVAITQLCLEWKGIDATIGSMWIRNKRDTGSDAWSSWREFSFADHKHSKSQITDMPTKLSQFQNDIGAGGGTNIIKSPTQPTGVTSGTIWI
jgi:hypothetical protein